MSEASTKTRPISQQASVKPVSLVSQTIANIRILVDGRIRTDVIPAKGDRPEREKFSQLAIIVGGERAIPWQVTTWHERSQLQEGCYTLSANSLKIGDWDSLQLDDRAENLVRLRDLTDEERSRFEVGKESSLSDFGV